MVTRPPQVQHQKRLLVQHWRLCHHNQQVVHRISTQHWQMLVWLVLGQDPFWRRHQEHLLELQFSLEQLG